LDLLAVILLIVLVKYFSSNEASKSNPDYENESTKVNTFKKVVLDDTKRSKLFKASKRY
jgi:hypothetical protein